ncbi:MAG: protein kinase [Planctomycetes bacterium]|nr:protein kinase [Planctomycetota bacterium]
MTDPHPNSAGDDPLDELIVECLARLSRGDTDPLEAMCAAHPEHASELRRRQRGLLDLGLWSRPKDSTRERIGSFQLIRELGRGGMGIVHLAQQEGPIRRLAAVKITVGTLTARAVARFDAERQALARLDHPNIAQVLEAGTTADGQPWYAMEFVDGRTITTYCAARSLGIEPRLGLFLQLCDAVQFAHQQGVLHRDLKPANVLVCERGGRPLVKVIDFGLAKALEDPFTDGQDLTEAGQILGTPEYMSPEQALPTAAGVDTRTDVYALGTILYELCCGALPFNFAALRRAGFEALQRAVCEQEAPRPSDRLGQLGTAGETFARQAGTTPERLRRALQGDLDAIAGKALAKRREERYAAVSELSADVRRHLRHEPVLASPPSTIYQVRKFVRRHRAGVAFAATMLLGLVVALFVVTNLLWQNSALLADRTDALRGFDTLDYADEFATLEARIDNELWRNHARLEQIGDLWPAMPDRLDDIEAWLARTRDIALHLPEFRRQLEKLELRGAMHDGSWHFDELRDKSLHKRLEPLVEGVAAALVPGGPIDQIAKRREWAAGLRERTITGPEAAARWQQAIATIADESQCPAYKGLRIEPQLGMLPLGRDEHSELYEFAWLQPDEKLPKRAADRWTIAADTCLVLVLIPGGKARLGLDRHDPRLPADLRPHQLEYAADDDSQGGSFVLELGPFFLAKYEMTQAQWRRVMGDNPSAYSAARRPDLGLGPTCPVDSVSARMADEAVRRLGLSLPTAAQWQYAARAGAAAPWWTGYELADWHDKENLADASLDTRLESGECDMSHDDGFPASAPVDSKAPNGFGLHHVIGNLREWSIDPAHYYKDAWPRPGDGALEVVRRRELLDRRRRFILGGSWKTAWINCRSTMRTAVSENQASDSFGLRPSRPLL